MKKISLFDSEKNNEHIYIGLLVLTILLFLLPLLTGIEGICFDDAAFISFPRIMAVARAFQQGEIPFWDSNAYSGAKPFYAMMEAPIYNIVFYPFYCFANLNDINQSFFVLYIVPFTLLTIFSGIGTYFFIRKVVKATPAIALLSGIMYALNPSMGMSTLSLIDTCVFTYIPWIILAIAKYLETHKFYWWLIGVIFFVLLNCAYTLNYTYRIYLFLGIITLILFIWYFIKDKKNLPYIIATMFIVVISIGLTAFIWSGIIEGLTWVTDKVANKLDKILKEITYSLPPAHLITLFIPGFNGTLTNAHTWGDGFLVHSADRILSGGVVTSFLILLSLLLIFNKKIKFKITDEEKIWLIIGNIVNFFALAIMLGKYSPIFYILCKLFPWFFGIPFPFYYHFAQHLGAIITAAVTLSILVNNKNSLSSLINEKLINYYLGFIVIFALIYIFLPVYYPTFFADKKFNNFQILLFYKDILWFLTVPIGYFIVMATGLFFFAKKYIASKKEIFLYFLFFSVAVDVFITGYPVLYKNQIMPRAYSLNKWQAFRRLHKNWPTNFDYFKQIKELKKTIKDKNNPRFVADVSITENLSWVTDTRSFTGYEAKPVFASMSKIISKFYKNWPYEMWAYILPKMLLSNMNVGYMLIYDHALGENKLYQYKNEDKEYYSIAPEEFISSANEENKKLEGYRKYFNKAHFIIHKLDEPMPYLYFQNKITYANEEEQLENLLYTDLRKNVCISELFKKNYRISSTSNEIKNDEKNYKNDFKTLNEKNKILKIDMKKNNTLKLNVSLTEPSFLVRSEAYHPDWKITINGKEGKIIPVNFLMQGVYLEAGDYEIVYSFFPKSIVFGFKIAALFLAIFLIIIFVVFISNIFYIKKIENK